MKVVWLPPTERLTGNPYWAQLQAALEKQGVEFVPTEDKFYLQWRWLVRHRGQVDVLHLHFLRHHYLNTAEKGRASGTALVKFFAKLLLARLLGYRVVWTVHNLYPHERLQPYYIERLAHVLVAQLSTAVVVHCEYAKEALAREFYRRRNVFTTVHPNFIEIYPNTVSRSEARAKLNLTVQQQVFLFFGLIRPYKGINSLVKAFCQLPDSNLALIIAGRPAADVTEEELQDIVQEDERITLVPEFIPDEELQIYFSAADISVLPFTNILSSGSVLLAMSFGCPVVAPAIGCLPELITNNETGILYNPADPNGLFEALKQGCNADLEKMGEQAYEWVKELTWEEMAKKTLQAYRS